MTPESFEALLRALDPQDRDRAAELYVQLRYRLVRVFEWRRCSSPDELVDETLKRVGQRLAGGVKLQADDPTRYAQGVAHHVYREAVRREASEHRKLQSGEWQPSQMSE